VLRSLAVFMGMVPMLPLAAARPFVGILLLAWISFMSPQDLVYGLAADLPWAQLSFAAIVTGCLVAGEPKRPRLDTTGWLIVLFMICISLTCLAALAPEAEVQGKWETAMKMFLFVLVAGVLLTDVRRIHALLWAMVISLGYYGIRGGVFTLLTGAVGRVYGPPNSMIGDNNHIAAALLVALPLMNYLRLQSAHRSVRQILAAAMVLTVLGS
jgi:putative inorganic carbon (HCO3(-)) transporter